MKKKGLTIWVMLVICVAYAVGCCLIPINHTYLFWLSLALSLAELFLVGIIIAIFAFADRGDKERLFDIAIVRYSVGFSILFIIMNLVGMFLPKMPLWLVVGMNVIVLAIYIIILAFMKGLKNESEKFDSLQKEQVAQFKMYSIKIEDLSRKKTSSELRDKILYVLDLLKYSDAIGPSQIADSDAKIGGLIVELEKNVEMNKEPDAVDCCERLAEIIRERNEICKLYK